MCTHATFSTYRMPRMPCITPRPRQRRKPGLTEHRIKKRNPNPQNLFTTPRCGAKTRYRMHGGATGSGNRNAFKHRLYAGADWAHVADLRSLIADCERFLSTLRTPNDTLLPRPSGAWARSPKMHKRSTAPSCNPKHSNTDRKGRSCMVARRSTGI